MTNILLTGGSGFMGKAIVAELIDPASPLKPDLIRIFDLDTYQGSMDSRMELVRGDVRDYQQVSEACRNIDMVIHSAAIVDWGTKSEEEILSVNVEGTKNIIQACKEQKVKFLVFTSSLDAVFSGKPLVDIDESIPYPENHSTSYCTSKYLAEKLVLACSGDNLKACIIRPADVYGEGDPYHIGPLLDMAKGGFYIRLGNGKSRCQHVYVGNIAYAHILAAHALLANNSAIAGNVYFITDGPGSNFFSFYDRIIEEAGYRIWPKNLWLPWGFAMMLGILSETLAFLVRPVKKYTPKMSRFAVTYTCTDFTFSSEKARKDFGFVPKYSVEEAVERTVRFYRELKEIEKRISPQS
ncbi:MAG: NAD-dependent epimerase/dehydratase family protein [Bacteroidetes bacterium]|nr:MAG: NAD-dependent epimerase/dehydratase family protein [Bacteroidota bacterium]